MRCCIQCFRDPVVRTRISEETGNFAKCDYCRREDLAIAPRELADLFESLLDYYAPWEFGVHYSEPNQSTDGEQLGYLLQEWEIFDEILPTETINRLLDDIMSCPQSASDLWGTKDQELGVWDEDEALLWEYFSTHIKVERRFLPSELFEFVAPENLSLIIEEVARALPAGSDFFRARLGGKKVGEYGMVQPFGAEEMGAPPADPWGRGGRANPPGISYLYAALEEETAIAEKRPGIGSLLSIARMITSRDVSLVDLGATPKLESPLGVDNLTFRVRAFSLLRALATELSRPINAEDPPLEYLPSQYLCEVFISLGYDGVIYRSSYSAGCNIVLFDLEVAKIVGVKLKEVKEMRAIYRDL